MTVLARSDSGSSSFPFLLIFIGIVIAIAIKWMGMGVHKELIAAEVRKRGGRFVRATWSPRLFLGDKNDTFYDVEMILRSGRRVSAVCKCNVVHGVYWQSAPWVGDEEENSPRIRSSEAGADPADLKIVLDCPRCGYGIRQGWVACPNCATPME